MHPTQNTLITLVAAVSCLSIGGSALADMAITSSSGCATITDIQSVNKEPMADIYRLDKSGFHTGGIVAQVLQLSPLGVVASVAVDVSTEVGVSAAKRAQVAAVRKEEVTSRVWVDVFDVTYKPDVGEPITITIRKSEIDRFSLEKGARVVMFDPGFDREITTDEGAKVVRNRPSIHVPRSGFWSTIKEIDVPKDKNYSDDYLDFCFAGQTGPSYRTMNGFAVGPALKESMATGKEMMPTAVVTFDSH